MTCNGGTRKSFIIVQELNAGLYKPSVFTISAPCSGGSLSPATNPNKSNPKQIKSVALFRYILTDSPHTHTHTRAHYSFRFVACDDYCIRRFFAWFVCHSVWYVFWFLLLSTSVFSSYSQNCFRTRYSSEWQIPITFVSFLRFLIICHLFAWVLFHPLPLSVCTHNFCSAVWHTSIGHSRSEHSDRVNVLLWSLRWQIEIDAACLAWVSI